MMQADRSHLPLKLNTAGVIPPIFASSLLLLPLTITQFAGNRPRADARWDDFLHHHHHRAPARRAALHPQQPVQPEPPAQPEQPVQPMATPDPSAIPPGMTLNPLQEFVSHQNLEIGMLGEQMDTFRAADRDDVVMAMYHMIRDHTLVSDAAAERARPPG